MDPERFEVTVRAGVVVPEGSCERRSLIPIVVAAIGAVEGMVRVENWLGYDVDDLVSPPPYLPSVPLP
jgi:hypothetical protein